MKEALKNCPEFLKGCPFKNVRSLDEVYDMLSKVPHAAGHEEQLSGAKLVEMLKKMHSESQALEEKLGDCPVFHKSEGCPFKSVRSEGKHLVEPVSTVVCAWKVSVWNVHLFCHGSGSKTDLNMKKFIGINSSIFLVTWLIYVYNVFVYDR